MVTIFAVNKPMAKLIKVVATAKFAVAFETGVFLKQDRVKGLFPWMDLPELVAGEFKIPVM